MKESKKKQLRKMYVVQSTLPIPYKAHGFDSKAAVEKTFVEPCIRGCGLVEG